MSLLLAAALWALQGPDQPPAAPAPQEPPPPPVEAPSDQPPAGGNQPAVQPSRRWQPLNKVDLIVNSDCITSTDVMRLAAAKRRAVTTPEERAQLFAEMATEQLRLLLAVQAGKDLGFEQPMVDRLVKDELDKRLELVGSISRLADMLAREDIDSATYKGDVESYIFSQLYTGSVTGVYPGPQGRHYVDRYVRPGQLAYEFERQGSDLDLPTRLVLRELLVMPRDGETVEDALQKARDLRRRIAEDGEDFLEAGERAGAVEPRNQGLMPPFTLDDLRRLGPELTAFAETAERGALSEVLPVHHEGRLRAFRILRVEERQEGHVASLRDRDFQRSLTKKLQEDRDEYRRQQALDTLLDAAYVWPPEVFGRAREQAGP